MNQDEDVETREEAVVDEGMAEALKLKTYGGGTWELGNLALWGRHAWWAPSDEMLWIRSTMYCMSITT